ncbi:MAG: ABC transporter [Hyphomicrobium sp. 32-62-53]|nr:MAG: ABC transporter [Hyphomicrobium sp. 12-62-95]OYX99893.1 MAG: ABC transporter [Hyphomicrobium sp. 32-62-53]
MTNAANTNSEALKPREGFWTDPAAYLGGMSRRRMAWTGLGLGAIILLSVNLISAIAFKNVKGDLTEDRLFTISDGTREILRSIDEPITARLYFSRRLAELAPEQSRYFQRVKALFEQYRDLSSGKLQLAVLDPEPFSDAEDRAVAAGLRGVRLNTEGEVGYFGLVATNSTDATEVVPFFAPDRETFLEYDVTKLIYNLANPKKRVVGLMSGLPLDGGETETPMGKRPQKPWMIMSQIRELFEVRDVSQTVSSIPSGIDVLMVVQPTGLTEEAAFAIDQYALKGGKVLVFIDPVTETNQLAMLKAPGEGRRRLAKVLVNWGVKFDSTKVAADIRHARRVQFGREQDSVTEFVAWLGLDERNINKDDVLAAGIEVLNVASSGFLEKADGATTSVQPFLKTSTDAAIIGAEKMGMGADPLGLLRAYTPGGKELTLAARLSGEAKTAFPNGKPAAEPEKKEGDSADTAKSAEAKTDTKPGADLVKSGTVNAIVVADADMLADQFWVSRQEMLGQEAVMPTAHNAALVLSALENLSGSNALIALRGRGVNERPFTWVEELRRNAERQFREKEQALEARLKSAQDELAKLQSSGASGIVMSQKERDAMEQFRTVMLETRRELREVKRALRSDIDRLDGWLKFANIALVPLMIAFGGLGYTVLRGAGRRKSS